MGLSFGLTFILNCFILLRVMYAYIICRYHVKPFFKNLSKFIPSIHPPTHLSVGVCPLFHLSIDLHVLCNKFQNKALSTCIPSS